jgi:hypothetical protein
MLFLLSKVVLGYEREERTTRNVIVTIDGGFARVCYSKRRGKKKSQGQHHETYDREGEKNRDKGEFDVPTRTAPTNGWSRTHRTAILAMLTPP